MNLRPSFSHRNKIGHQGHLAETAIGLVMTTASRAGLRVPMRWQPKQYAERSAKRNASASNLSQSDQDILLRQQALAEAQRGHYAEAIALFTELIERNPSNAADYNNRGLVYFQSRQWDEALLDYNYALKLNPRLDSAYNNRANYYAAQGEYLDAILDYDTALDLNPSNIRAWINQGITFRDLHMYEQALECFDMALCMGQLEGHIYAERGRTHHLWGDWNCAIADYKRAFSHLPSPIDSPTEPGSRLRIQVENWMDELLSPCL